VPPPRSADDLPEVAVADGGTCRTRVPSLQIAQGASPGEIVIGDCSQVSADLNASVDQQAPLELSFTFPLTFADPTNSFTFPPSTCRVIDVHASFTVDASITASAQLSLTGGQTPAIGEVALNSGASVSPTSDG